MRTYAEPHAVIPGAWRELVRLVLASLATGAAVSIVLALAVFVVANEASTAPRPAPDEAAGIAAAATPVAAPKTQASR